MAYLGSQWNPSLIFIFACSVLTSATLIQQAFMCPITRLNNQCATCFGGCHGILRNSNVIDIYESIYLTSLGNEMSNATMKETIGSRLPLMLASTYFPLQW